MAAVHYAKKNSNMGFVTLYSVIILGSVGLALVAALAMSGIWAIRTSGNDRDSAQARKAADSCVELALQTIWDNNSFSGNGSSTLGGSICTFSVTNTGGDSRIINATGTVGSLLRKIFVSVDALSPAINVSDWQEVP